MKKIVISFIIIFMFLIFSFKVKAQSLSWGYGSYWKFTANSINNCPSSIQDYLNYFGKETIIYPPSLTIDCLYISKTGIISYQGYPKIIKIYGTLIPIIYK